METKAEYVLEMICTRLDRINRRTMIALILTIFMLFASNAAWLWAWMQYDYTSETVETATETVTVDGKDGIASYANHGGIVNNGQR